MDFFDRHKALIITLLFYSVLMLALYNINISNRNDKVRETLIQLQELQQQPKEEPDLSESKEEEQQEVSRQKLQTHQAFDQTKKEQDVDSRLEDIFEKNAAEQEASDEPTGETSGAFQTATPQKEKKESSRGNDSEKKISGSEGDLASSSIAYSLVGRKAIEIPNPVYTCDTRGKIVINITVNAEGEVTATSVNEASSTSDNECIKTKALQYARGARFSKLPGRSVQPGTITYYFQD